tara:strand:+ start:1128 stop:1745 length:618 start_codon:yes stop_codon:yes gene_type:complete
MNHLAHFFLAEENGELLVGSFLGDFIKGRLKGERSTAIENGIRLHRAIDAYTDRHTITRTSQQRYEDRFRRFSGIMTDVIFDHFLAIHWREYHCEELQTFSNTTFSTLSQNREQLPPFAIKAYEGMQCSNALLNYRDPESIERSFRYLSGRLRRDNPLAEAYGQFLANRDELESDFIEFFPALAQFTLNWIADSDRRSAINKECK